MAGTLRSSTARGADLTPDEAAVRLLDEHERRVVVLKPDAVSREAPREAAGEASPTGGRESRPALRSLALALILLGALALADAAVTLVWQEPFSALYAKLRQDHLSGVLRKEERAHPTPGERHALARLSSARAGHAARFLSSASRARGRSRGAHPDPAHRHQLRRRERHEHLGA